MKKWWLLLDKDGKSSGACDDETSAIKLKNVYEESEDVSKYGPHKIISVMEVPKNYDGMVNLANLGSIVRSLVKILEEK